MRQLLFDFAVDPPLRFHMQKGAGSPVEVWEYSNVLRAVEKDEYVVLTMEEGSAFIPKYWVVKVEQ